LEDPLSETPAEQLRRESDERQVDAEAAIEQDATIQALKATFGARLVPGSVKPIDP
jgi:DNA polymerase-3 subunit gamma/tau